MILNSFSFLAFLTVLLIVYWKLPKKFQLSLLLLASYVFYAAYKLDYVVIMVAATLINFLFSLSFEKFKRHIKPVLFLAIVANIGALFAFKYLNFFSTTFTQLHLPFTLPTYPANYLIPLGISFYTLQIIGYHIDLYRHKYKAEKRLINFALFHSLFANISAGPIERGDHLLPQFAKPHSFDAAQVTDGLKLFAYGLFKKMVIADNLALVVDRVFATLPEFKGLSLVLVIIFYSWQIYMDFSSYTDMARGVAKMLGIDLLENFNFPYFSTSISDFWRRWHLSFSSWLRDYVYIPLGGNRKGAIRLVVNTLIVFTLSGLWHGAAWTFVVWGILHGLAISIERLGKRFLGKTLPMPKILQNIYAYITLSIFWVVFRANNLPDALYILKNATIGLKNFASPSYVWASLNQLFVFNRVEMAITFAVLLLAVLLEFIRTKTTLATLLAKQPPVVRFAFYIVLVFLTLQLRNSDIKQFIYTRF